MTQDVIHQRIEEALKAIIPFALQADEILEGLSQDNKAKFTAIFPKDSPFESTGNRFLPYIEELDANFKNLPSVDDPVFEARLTDLVKKMEALQIVLQGFHQIRDYDDDIENPNRPLNS